MTTASRPAVAVGPPHVQNAYGLFSVVNFLSSPDGQPYWESGGITWEAFKALLGAVGEAGSATGLPKDTSSNDRWYEKAEASPFTVYGSFTGTPIGRGGLAEMQARALDLLLAGEQARAEYELWTGTSGATPNLADDTTDLGDSSDPVEWVAIAEEFLANTYGNQGIIHMSRANAIRAHARNAIKQNGSVLLTGTGTPVVAGTGYSSDVVKVSPAVLGLRSEVFYPSSRVDRGDGLDPTRNDYYALAERTYLLGFDPTGVGVITTGVAAPAVGSPF